MTRGTRTFVWHKGIRIDDRLADIFLCGFGSSAVTIALQVTFSRFTHSRQVRADSAHRTRYTRDHMTGDTTALLEDRGCTYTWNVSPSESVWTARS